MDLVVWVLIQRVFDCIDLLINVKIHLIRNKEQLLRFRIII